MMMRSRVCTWFARCAPLIMSIVALWLRHLSHLLRNEEKPNKQTNSLTYSLQKHAAIQRRHMYLISFTDIDVIFIGSHRKQCKRLVTVKLLPFQILSLVYVHWLPVATAIAYYFTYFIDKISPKILQMTWHDLEICCRLCLEFPRISFICRNRDRDFVYCIFLYARFRSTVSACETRDKCVCVLCALCCVVVVITIHKN